MARSQVPYTAQATGLLQKLAKLPANKADIALLLKMAPGHIDNYLNAGLFTPDKKGLFNPVECVFKYIDALRKSPKALAAFQRAQERDGEPKSDGKRLTKAKADLHELKARQLSGELIDVAEFTDVFSKAIASAQTRLLAVPSKVAMKAAAMKSPAQVQALVHAEIEEALAEISSFQLEPSSKAVTLAEDDDAEDDSASLVQRMGTAA